LSSPLFPYTTLFRSRIVDHSRIDRIHPFAFRGKIRQLGSGVERAPHGQRLADLERADPLATHQFEHMNLAARRRQQAANHFGPRSEEHTSELQSREK